MPGRRGNGEGSVNKRNDRWYGRITLPGGRRKTILLTTGGTRSKALACLAKVKADIASGSYSPDSADTRVRELYADLVRDYRVNGKIVRDIEKRWKHLDVVFGGDICITPIHLDVSACRQAGEDFTSPSAVPTPHST